MYPANNEIPSFGQLCIIDPNETLQHRSSVFSHLNADTLYSLDNMMREYNAFSQSYEMMAQELKDQIENNRRYNFHLFFQLQQMVKSQNHMSQYEKKPAKSYKQ